MKDREGRSLSVLTYFMPLRLRRLNSTATNSTTTNTMAIAITAINISIVSSLARDCGYDRTHRQSMENAPRGREIRGGVCVASYSRAST